MVDPNRISNRFRKAALRVFRTGVLTQSIMLAIAGVWLLGAFETANAFKARPVPGRLLLVMEEGVDLSGLVRSPGKVPSTGVAGLDPLNQLFAIQSFEPQFPGGSRSDVPDLSRFYVLGFDPETDLETIRSAYAAHPAIRIAEFDLMVPVDLVVNDVGTQWHLESTQGKDAHVTGGWNHSTGDESVVLAIADTGVDWEHPDLGGSPPDHTDGNIWINWEEMNGTAGVDDDKNGYIDDVRGWDFVANLAGAWPGEDATVPDNDPRDYNGHGTHVAGIAGASTNNGLGVAGVGFDCKIMALRIGGSIDDGGNEQGVVLMSSAASALYYARRMGAVAFNCSWGSSYTAGLEAAVDWALEEGLVIVVSAGNDNAQTPSYLGSRGDCFDVAASGLMDARAPFSNYGTWVDITAPGVSIFSTYFDSDLSGSAQHTYTSLQGTSMAAPIVTGVVGLVSAHSPGLSGPQLVAQIQQGADDIDAINASYAGLLGAGRVNVLRTFQDRFVTVPDDYATFPQALAASGPGDTLAMRGGDVVENRLYVWQPDRMVLGAWDTGFTTRDPENNPTIVQPQEFGPPLEIVAGIDNSLVVDGFLFTGGSARNIADPPGILGGGVLCVDASPVISRCRFESNTAGDEFTAGAGGGGFFARSSARLVDCVFENNSAQKGAGLYLYQSTLVWEGGRVSNNTLFDASGTLRGAGLFVEGSTADVLTDVTFVNNTGADVGGALYVHSGFVDGTGLIFQNHSAQNSGGNIGLGSGATLRLRASDVRTGSAPFGGGIAMAQGATLELQSCVVAQNTAEYLGGGLFSDQATGSLQNVTLFANAAGFGGDALYMANSPDPGWTLHNSLITDHSTPAYEACLFTGASPFLDYNLFWNNAGGRVSGGSLGPNVLLGVSPLYVDAPSGILFLGAHSPALDSGNPQPGAGDPDGTRADRGAYGGRYSRSPAPGPPSGLQTTYEEEGGPILVAWSPNPEPDIGSYVVYRGATNDFVPSTANLIATTVASTITYTDPDGTDQDYYRVAAIDLEGASSGFSRADTPSSSTDAEVEVPRFFTLHPNHPNPFNPTTTVGFELPRRADVRIEVFDASGRLVRRLLGQALDAGFHEVDWDGRDESGRPLASGVFVYRLSAGDWGRARKMILVR